jgi:putative hydrolase of the HAD superfamily
MEAMKHVYLLNDLEARGIEDFNSFFMNYNYHNNKLWYRYSNGFIKQDELKWKRMWLTLLEYKIADEPLARQMSVQFLEVLPTKTALFPYAIEILEYLKNKGYTLHLITNGFENIQHTKLANCGLRHYFTEVITSEASNSVKPNKGIFDYAFSKANAVADESIMLGDNLEADIQGGINAGIDTVFINHINADPHIKPTYMVKDLLSLKDIF